MQVAGPIFSMGAELHLTDGTLHTIGVAPPGASSARAFLDGANGVAARLRAWNAAGESEPSPALPLPP